MSGIVSGIGKIFTTVADGVSTALGSAVTGVGATVATAGAASGGGALASGAFKSVVGGLKGGVLSNILGGAARVVTGAGIGLMGATAPALAEAAPAVTSAIAGGMAPAVAAVAPEAPTFLDKAGDFLMSEQGAGLIGGLGKGYAEYEKMNMEAEERQKDREYLLAKEQRVRESFNVPGSALPDGASTGVVNDVARPTPTQQFSRDFDMVYDPELGRIVRKARG